MNTTQKREGKTYWARALRSTPADIIQFILLAAVCLWFFGISLRESGYNWQWYQVPQYLFSFEHSTFKPGPLLLGLMVTLKISAVSLFFAFAIGLATALLLLSSSFVGRMTARMYLEIIRNRYLRPVFVGSAWPW